MNPKPSNFLTLNLELGTLNFELRTLNFKLQTILIPLILTACTKKNNEQITASQQSAISLAYAEGFSITQAGDVKVVEVKYPYQGATSGHRYLLAEKGKSIPDSLDDLPVIHIPVQRIVCTSTTHIPMLDYLNETDKLVGFPTTDYISSSAMRKRIDAGNVQDLGTDKALNIEILAALKADLVMGYTISGNYGQFNKIESMGIPVVMNAEYLEKDPLGRAEWIKFIAAFFNKEAMADSVFTEIERVYLQTKQLTAGITERPTVMSGIVYRDGWFLPGGENYAARLFNDAGYDYLWKDNPSHGFIQISFESVYEKAHDADLWIGTGAYETLQELKNAEHRYAQFKPFKEKKVYTYNRRKGAKGGNEFLELGYLRPDIILKDLVAIAHPDLLPAHTLYFHGKLE